MGSFYCNALEGQKVVKTVPCLLPTDNLGEGGNNKRSTVEYDPDHTQGGDSKRHCTEYLIAKDVANSGKPQSPVSNEFTPNTTHM